MRFSKTLKLVLSHSILLQLKYEIRDALQRNPDLNKDTKKSKKMRAEMQETLKELETP